MAAGSANLAFLEGKSNDESSRLTGLRISGRRAGSSELNLLTAASLAHLLRWFSSLCVCSCLQIREELRANGIDVYPQKEFDEDAEDRLINDKIRVSSLSRQPSSLLPGYRDVGPGLETHLRSTADSGLSSAQQEMIPFAVVGSDQEYQVNGKRILGRKTKWGTIEGKD